MRIPRRLLMAPLLLALLAPAGCDDPGSPEGLRVTTAALAPCSDNGNGDGAFPAGSDKVVVRLTGGAIPADQPRVEVFPAGSEDEGGEVTLRGVPFGEGMTLEAVACNGGEPVWAGRHDGIAVQAGDPRAFETLFLTPVGTLACVGFGGAPTMRQGHAFAATWGDRDGAWLLGGFSTYEANTGRPSRPPTLQPTNRVTRYTRVESAFSDAGELADARAMALVHEANDGRLRVVGGTSKLTLDLSGLAPPLRTTADDAPDPSVELFDPATGKSTPGVDVELPALPALTLLDDGRVLAVGGISGDDDEATAMARILGSDEATIDLDRPRYGATAIGGVGGQALVWGGNADGDRGAVATWIDADAGSATVLEGEHDLDVSFMAAGAFLGEQDGEQHFLVLGGTDITEAGSFDSVADTVRVLRVAVNPDKGSYVATPLELPEDSDGMFRRAAARLVEDDLGDLVLVGGFTSFGSAECPGTSTDNGCLQEDVHRLRVTETAVAFAGESFVSSVGTFGATFTPLDDGSWLLGGGLASIGAADVDRGAALYRFQVDDPALCDHTGQ